jgi:hypothetical protein
MRPEGDVRRGRTGSASATNTLTRAELSHRLICCLTISFGDSGQPSWDETMAEVMVTYPGAPSTAARLAASQLSSTRLRAKAELTHLHDLPDRLCSDRGEHPEIAVIPIGQETVGCQLAVGELVSAEVPDSHARAKMPIQAPRACWSRHFANKSAGN